MAENHFKSALEVLTLFLIPIGGGIPGGVLLAKSRGIAWPEMTALYFISDVILAFIFDPIMHLLVYAAKHSPFFARFKQMMKLSVSKATAHYGTSLGPLALILVAFGADPMTGRAATAVGGYGFVSGWALAITGDMAYYLLIMASTLWLSGILGDGTMATLIILAIMIAAPAVIRKVRVFSIGR